MITAGQVTAGTASVLYCRVPPGPCQVMLSNSGTVTAFVGIGTAASASSGFPVPAGHVVPFAGFNGSPGAQLSVVTALSTTAVGYLISTAYGQTGP